MPRTLTYLLLLLTPVLMAAEPAQAEPLRPRPRVFVDPLSGTSFRFPFTWYVPDHCGDVMIEPRAYQVWQMRQMRQRSGAQPAAAGGTTTAPGENPVPAPPLPRWLSCGIRHFSRTVAEVPDAILAQGLAVVAAHLGGGEPTFTSPFDYDAEAPDRPHITPWDDRPAITGLIAVFPDGRMLLVHHGDRYSGLLVGTDVPPAQAEEVIRSFEIMRPFAKRRVTWREWHGLCLRAIDTDGTATPVGRCEHRKDFNQGWEFESRFFHFTGTANPSEMQRVAGHLDLLHRSLQAWLPLDRPQRVKFEIVLTMTKDEFVALAPRFTWAGPATVKQSLNMQGFFSMAARAVLSYTQLEAKTVGTTRLRLSHEVVHQYLHLHGNQWGLPQWFDEGLAVLFENGAAQGALFLTGNPGTRMIFLRQYYQQKQQQIATPTQYFAGRLGLNVHMYAEMFAMVHSLVVDQPDGLALLADFWRRLRSREAGSTDLLYATLMARRLKEAGDDRETCLARWGTDLIDYVVNRQAKQGMSITPVAEEPIPAP